MKKKTLTDFIFNGSTDLPTNQNPVSCLTCGDGPRLFFLPHHFVFLKSVISFEFMGSGKRVHEGSELQNLKWAEEAKGEDWVGRGV